MARRILLLVLLVATAMAAGVAVSVASPAQTNRSNRARAVTAAEHLLGLVVLPPGAARVPTAPPSAGGLLARPDQAFLSASQIDRHAFWTTASSPATAMASITAHLPGAAERVDHGFSGSEHFATYAFPTIDRTSLGARQLVLKVLGQSNGGSLVRADGEVRYIAPRPYDERIPTQARVLDVTVGSNLSRPLLSVAVTNASAVRRIARVVDHLPFVGNESGVSYSCPSFSATFPVDRFIFREAAGGACSPRSPSSPQRQLRTTHASSRH